MNKCPWCDAKAVDITTSKDRTGFDRRSRYMCCGKVCHEWREGDTPYTPEPPEAAGLWSKVKSIFKEQVNG